jgi:hypothetical protein
MSSTAPRDKRSGHQKRRKPFKKRLSVLLENQTLEFIGTVIAVSVIAIVGYLVHHFLGQAKFFDYIPVQWVFDVAHIVLIGRLVWGIIKGFKGDDE